MVSVGRKNLFVEKTRLFISMGGVAFSVLLILIVLGLYLGWNEMAGAYINSIDVDLWISQKASTDMFHGVSLIPAEMEERLKALPEVNSVNRLLGRQVAIEINGGKVATYLAGYDTDSGMGGPIRIYRGASQPGRGEIIIDRVLARTKNLDIGEQVRILGRDFKVVGISDRGNMMLYQYSFITQKDAEEVLSMEGLSNYYLVSLNNPVEKDTVIQKINEQMTGVQAMTSQDFTEVNRKLIDESFLPIIFVIVLIGFAVGVMVIGLTIYTATVEKSREYGILKAVGASNWQLYRVIFEQALVSGVLGYITGTALTVAVTYLAQNLVPSFVISLNPMTLAGVLGAAILMSLAASYIPVRRIVSIDPAMVFKN